MNSFSQLVRLCFIISCLSLGSLPVDSSGANVVAHTQDGRILQGEVDVRSDAHALWLRQEAEDLIFAYAVDWQEIERLEYAGTPISPLELKNNLQSVTSVARKGMLTEYELPTTLEAESPPTSYARPPQPWIVPVRRPPIVALETAAQLANLDRTVEPDGLRVQIAPIDGQGLAWPVRGNVTLRLFGQKQDFHTGEIQFLQLEQWNVPVTEAEFSDGVAVFTVRFRHTQPERDFELCPLGQLNVSLGAYGEGNFQASIPVNLLEWNPFRDQLWYQEGSRFFRGELTHNPWQDRPYGPIKITVESH